MYKFIFTSQVDLGFEMKIIQLVIQLHTIL